MRILIFIRELLYMNGNMYKYLLAFLLLCLTSCSGGGGSGGDSTSQPLTQGSRTVGLAIGETPSVAYAMAYDQAIATGVRQVKVSFNWCELEPSVGNYDNTYLDIADSFYPLVQGDITFVLRPLDGPGPCFPVGLAGRSFDDPLVIAAFDNFLIHLHGRINNINATGKLKWIHVGNEIDGPLASNATAWAEWGVFYDAAKLRIEALWGNAVTVSSIIKFSALTNPSIYTQYLNLLPRLDAAVINYYPLKGDFTVEPLTVIPDDFNTMVSRISNKSIILQECGLPSSPVNNSSELLQADFITEIFRVWDIHKNRIQIIDFAWQYDVSEAQADQWVIEYGISGLPGENVFKYYLWTLGFLNYDSTEKLAWQRFKDELQKRNWSGIQQ